MLSISADKKATLRDRRSSLATISVADAPELTPAGFFESENGIPTKLTSRPEWCVVLRMRSGPRKARLCRYQQERLPQHAASKPFPEQTCRRPGTACSAVPALSSITFRFQTAAKAKAHAPPRCKGDRIEDLIGSRDAETDGVHLESWIKIVALGRSYVIWNVGPTTAANDALLDVSRCPPGGAVNWCP